MNEVKLSIICCTYNHEHYIRQCLEGFVMQKTNFRFEVLVHDDASTDGTAAIIREFEQKYPNIIKPIYQQENQYSKGVDIFFQIMIPQTRGQYIAICEGDDYWIDPHKLQKQVDFLEANPEYSMCSHNAFVYKMDSHRNVSAYLFNRYSLDRDLEQEDVICNWTVPTASILARRELIEPLNGLTRIYSGDYSMILSLYYKGKIRYLNSVSSVYRYFLVGQSSSASYNSDFVMSQHILLLESYNKCTKQKYEETIQKRIKWLKQEIKYQTIKRNYGVVIAMLVMPRLTCKKIVKKIRKQ